MLFVVSGAMDLLPDDVLAQVLSLVSLRDLFDLRLVCKRFAALALHPDVWRGRDIGDLTKRDRRATLCRAVRLAPCVFNMTVIFPPEFSKCSHTFTTACAARKLTICVRGDKGAMRAAALIRHHRDLGRLRKLHMIFNYNLGRAAKAVSKEHAIVLFDTLLSTPDLDDLFVRGIDKGIDDKIVPTEFSPAILHSTVNASLTHVIFCLTSALECVFNFILDRHAATLKTVDLEADSIPTSSTLLLAKIPHLTTLLCPMVPGIDALVSLKSLKTITIFYPDGDDDEDDAAKAATATLLRHAQQLQKVDLSFTFPFSTATELVTALASSGRSCVETLTLRIEGGSTPQLMRKLLSALSSLPALRRLYMNVTKGSVDGRALLAWAAGRAHPSRPLDVQLGRICVID